VAVAASSDDISGHRSFGRGRRTGCGLAVRRCDKTAVASPQPRAGPEAGSSEKKDRQRMDGEGWTDDEDNRRWKPISCHRGPRKTKALKKLKYFSVVFLCSKQGSNPSP
jgi:hypothetical protein